MVAGSQNDTALVLLGHGTEFNENAGLPVYQHAETLRTLGCFGEVREAFWKQSPQLLEVLAGLKHLPRVVLVPLFMSEGYFSAQIIPRALGAEPATPAPGRMAAVVIPRNGGSQKLFYCRPVGTHDGMTSVVLARALEAVRVIPAAPCPEPSETTLFIAGHGTGRNGNSRKSIEHQVELLRALGLYAGVDAVFMEEEPRIASCWEKASTRNIVVVPYFLADGMHVQEDIPVLLGANQESVHSRVSRGQPGWDNPTERNGKRLWYARAVGTDPHLINVILDRVQELLPVHLSLG